MKNIYNVTKGQLVTLWIFGVIGWFVSIDNSNYSGLATFFSVVIPMFLVFYTIGWRAFRVSDSKASFSSLLSKITPSRKQLKLISVPLIIIIVLSLCIPYFSHLKAENERIKKIKKDYGIALTKIEPLREKVASCLQPAIDKKYKEVLRDCNLLKGKIRQDYNFCVSLDIINSPTSCMYDHDYEKIDCSEETVMKDARLKFTEFDVPSECGLLVSELKDLNKTINEYNNLANERK